MNPIRRELLNGLSVLVVASLLSAAFAAFQVSFNVLLWVLILMGIAIAVSGYVVFEIALGYMASTEDRDLALAESMRRREEEWLKRVGTPARLELNRDGDDAGLVAIAEAVKVMEPGSDYTVVYYFGSEGAGESRFLKEKLNANREKTLSTVLDRLKLGAIREYKRIIVSTTTCWRTITN